jgi:hypothetical protein
MRMVLYPAMVPVFLHEMRAVEGAAWWETLACVGSQVRRRRRWAAAAAGPCHRCCCHAVCA